MKLKRLFMPLAGLASISVASPSQAQKLREIAAGGTGGIGIMKWRTIGLALTVAAMATAMVPESAQALPPNEVWRYYFDDATFSNDVGSRFVTSCFGVENLQEGRTSPYVMRTNESCQTGAFHAVCYDHGRQVPCW